MKIAFNPSTVAALTAPPNNKDITFDLRGQNIFARGVKFCGTDTNTWRDIKINNVSIGSNILDLRNGSNTTLTNSNGVVTINSTWRPVVDNLISYSTTSSLSANQGRILAGLINGKSDSDHNHDGRYVKRFGDTMLGALNFAKGTWNLVGDDSYVGDCNVSGHFGIKAANTTYPGIAFWNNSSTFLGNLTAYSDNIKYGAFSLQFLDNGTTIVKACTLYNPFSNYNSNAVADGQAVCVWGQNSYLGNLAHDTGNISLWLRRGNAKLATLNLMLDGEYYAVGNQRLAHVSEIPTSLKNPHALTISLNGTSQGPYDGSAAKNINITPGSIGAATSGHNHDGRYVRYYAITTLDCNNLAVGLTAAKTTATNAAHTNPSAYLYISDVRTPFQIQIPDSGVQYIYKRYYSSGKWSGWFKLNAGYADSAGSATKLQTPRSIWGQSFDGTRDVNGTIYINNSDSSNGAIRLNNNVNSNARISAIEDQVIFNTGGAIRFGGTSWDYNQWAGLKYSHHFKTIYLGLADGSIFNANSAQDGGTLNLRAGICNIDLNSGTSIRGLSTDGSPDISYLDLYDTSISLRAYENISMKSSGPGSSASISSDIRIESSRGVYLNSGNSGNVYLCQGGGKVGIGTTSPTQKLDVIGNIRATGQIIREGSSQFWVYGRTGALLRETTSIGYHVLWSLKTTNGSWDFGEYNTSGWYNVPVLSYITDSNYNSGSNTTTYQIKFPLDNGTVALTKDIPANGGNADTLDGYHASGLLTALSNSNNGISITVGGTTKSVSNISVNYAKSAGNANTLGGMPKNPGRAPFGTIPYVEYDGVMEIGKYIDFHNDNGGSYDYSTRLQVIGNYRNTINLPLENGTLALTSYGGDDSHPIFLGYLDLDHGSDGTVSSSFHCLGYSVSFTYTRGGNYCKIVIPDTTRLSFYINAAIASVNYSGGGMDTWTNFHRGTGAWWLHCYAAGWNEVRVKGFCQRNGHNDSWWGGNPLWANNDGANRITVCIFGYVRYR